MREQAPVAMRRMISTTTIPSRLAAIAAAGLEVERIDDMHFRVAGAFSFFPITGFWRNDAGTQKGYGTRALIGTIIGLSVIENVVKRAEKARAVKPTKKGKRK